jgi:phosphatidylinositol transfer protein SFH5
LAVGPDGTHRYNIYGRNNDLATAFSDVQRFIRCALRILLYYAIVDIPSITRRWRVALMEEGIKLVDFETVDQMIQVHGTF